MFVGRGMSCEHSQGVIGGISSVDIMMGCLTCLAFLCGHGRDTLFFTSYPTFAFMRVAFLH